MTGRDRLSPHARKQWETVLAGYERKFKEESDVQSLANAVAVCGWNGLVLPEWCVAPVGEALDLYNQRGGRGRGQSPKNKLADAQKHKHRHAMVDFYLLFPGPDGRSPTLEKAFEHVASKLHVSAYTVEKSYRKIESTRK